MHHQSLPMTKQNEYLRNHPRAQAEVSLRKIQERCQRYRLDSLLEVSTGDREHILKIAEAAKIETAALDSCYVLKTDLPKNWISAEKVHE